MQAIIDGKTNKQETVLANDNIRLMHKMITNLSVLSIEALKSGLLTNESQVSKQQRVKFMCEQSKRIALWIQSFNPDVVLSERDHNK